jgi:hypothetical protein
MGVLFFLVNRQNWVGRIDPHDSHFLAIAIAEQQLLQAEFDDCVSANSSGATCCRSIALIVRERSYLFTELILVCVGWWNLILALLQVMFLLLVRHVIVIVRDVSMLQDATVLFSVSSTTDLVSMSY